MKAILKCESPKSCELIINGDKTILLSKTRPKLEPPFKCYIYCTKGMELWGDGSGVTWRGIDSDEDMEQVYNLNPTLLKLNGSVICEFVCDKIDTYLYGAITKNEYWIIGRNLEQTCMNYDELQEYGNGKTLYGLHISDVKIYDEPKELSEFRHECTNQSNCDTCPSYEPMCGLDDDDGCQTDGYRCVTRPPQSWCYVEELAAKERLKEFCADDKR